MDATRETPRQLFKMMLGAFPDFRATVDEILEDGDKIVARVTFSGTHEGEFMGMPASGNQVAWNAIDILQFRDDKVVAHWGVMDMASAMAQMGAPR
jgi:predicted ester cyclase